ncbi:MAG: class II fructose-bisphosphatase [Epsilonproteobacteria bacterium]|nr:MAG: class II fructose-bisphosphatase [Campylobacterota bacterium]RLA68197.1 MAG: class II fructose-bisphosphatase [Campylobacterota bacterium]
MDRNLAIEFVRATEAAAMASARLMGRGDEKLAMAESILAMKAMIDSIECKAKVIIGEKGIFQGSSIEEGTEIGKGEGPELEIALNPLEGAKVCATGGYNALSLLAIAEKGSIFSPPEVYMDKIGVGPEARDVIDLRESPKENLNRLADIKKCRVQDLTCVILNRPRHEKLIQEVRNTGARIQLIFDGDVAGAISTCMPDSGIDIMFGEGGAAEGVMAAAAIKCMGGGFQGIFRPKNSTEEKLLIDHEISLDRVFDTEDLVEGDIVFSATGVTNGSFLNGVLFKPWGAITHSIVMRSQSGTLRHIKAEHHFDRKPRY